MRDEGSKIEGYLSQNLHSLPHRHGRKGRNREETMYHSGRESYPAKHRGEIQPEMNVS